MGKISNEVLKSTEDWRDLYLESGQEMLDFARELITSDKSADMALGLKIIEGVYFEEDEENPDVPPSLSKLDFDKLIPTLNTLKKDSKYASRAKKCLKIIALEKGEKKEVDITKALKDLEAKGKGKQRDAVVELIRAHKSGVDIQAALPIIFAREEKLAMETDAMELVATYYIDNKMYRELEDLLNRDEAGSIRMYRGITAAINQGFDIKELMNQPSIFNRLKEISVGNNSVVSIEEFIN